MDAAPMHGLAHHDDVMQDARAGERILSLQSSAL